MAFTLAINSPPITKISLSDDLRSLEIYWRGKDKDELNELADMLHPPIPEFGLFCVAENCYKILKCHVIADKMQSLRNTPREKLVLGDFARLQRECYVHTIQNPLRLLHKNKIISDSQFADFNTFVEMQIIKLQQELKEEQDYQLTARL